VEVEHTRRINGTSFTFLETRVPLRNAADEITGVLTIARDTTERKRADRPISVTSGAYPSEAMAATLELALMAAKKNSTILLLGESGSGKDYIAKYIHEHSDRSGWPYFSINCAAIPSELAESELFGHEKGAFTGAVAQKRGLLELAEGGTLLLNEIGELSPLLQAKLLTFLDTRAFTRVGGVKEIIVNVRLLAATNRDLWKEVQEGIFRKDLFYRINVLSIKIPPLRERTEDIPVLVEEILSQLHLEYGLERTPIVDSATLEKLKTYTWPGNVRELRNVLERAVMLSDGPTIDFSSLGLSMEKCTIGRDWSFSTTFPVDRTLPDVVDELTKSVLLEALRLNKRNKTMVAKSLGVARDSIYRYMKKFGIEDDMGNGFDGGRG
jgi:two-component system, NtrC family, response regulator AtoC